MDRYQSQSPTSNLIAALKHQRKSFVGVVLVFVILGVVASVIMPKRYSALTQVMVQVPTQPNSEADPVALTTLPNDPIAPETQVELLRSPRFLFASMQAAGVALPTEETKASSIPLIDVESVSGTPVLTLSVEGNSANDVETIALSIPTVYNKFLKDQRQNEVDSAINFLSIKLEEETKKLKAAQDDLEKFKRGRTLPALENEGQQRSAIFANAQESVRRAEADYASAVERVRELKSLRDSLPKTWFSPTKNSNQQQLEQQRALIADLKGQREALLVTLLPDAIEVRSIDARIAEAKRRLRDVPTTQDNSSSGLHPELIELDTRLADAKATEKAALAGLNHLRESQALARKELQQYGEISPAQSQLEQTVESLRLSITDVSRSLSTLQVRRSSVKDSVLVLSQPTKALQVRPRPILYVALSLILGAFFGASFAMLKDSGDQRVTSAEGARSTLNISAHSLTAVRLRPSALFPRADDGSTELASATFGLPQCISVVAPRNPKTSEKVVASLAGSASANGKTLVVRFTDSADAVSIVGLGDSNPITQKVQPGATHDLLECKIGILHLTTADQENFSAALNEFKRTYAHILFDLPPVLLSEDFVVAISLTESFVLALELGQTKTVDASRAREILDIAGVKSIVAVVV